MKPSAESDSTELMDLLLSASGPLSGAALAERFGMTRAGVHKRIQALRARGYAVSGTQRVGYRWVGPTDVVDPAVLRRGLVRSVRHAGVTLSTQDDVKKRAALGEPEGYLMIADRQRSGRGRRGSSWVSAFGGLWYSLLLRPAGPPSGALAISLVAALDWVDVLRARGVPAAVKWPNDVWADGKKIAGLLVEMSSETDRVEWMVLGVGVNVNNRPPQGTAIPAGAVAEWTGPVRRGGLLADWLDRFSASYAVYKQKGFPAFQRHFERRSLLTGQTVTFDGQAGPEKGRVSGVDQDGRLRVSTARGPLVVSGGDVHWVRPVP